MRTLPVGLMAFLCPLLWAHAHSSCRSDGVTLFFLKTVWALFLMVWWRFSVLYKERMRIAHSSRRSDGGGYFPQRAHSAESRGYSFDSSGPPLEISSSSVSAARQKRLLSPPPGSPTSQARALAAGKGPRLVAADLSKSYRYLQSKIQHQQMSNLSEQLI